MFVFVPSEDYHADYLRPFESARFHMWVQEVENPNLSLLLGPNYISANRISYTC